MDIISRLKEWWATRGYAKVKVFEQFKRAKPFNVCETLKPLTKDDLFQWVCDNIKYKREKKDYWKLPSETLNDKCGDCEDGAILLASLFLSVLPKREWWRVFVYIFEEPAHAVVVYRGKVYDWTQKAVFPLSQTKSWKLWYMFNFRNAYTIKENIKKWRSG